MTGKSAGYFTMSHRLLFIREFIIVGTLFIIIILIGCIGCATGGISVNPADNKKAAEMLKELSDRLGVQIVMVTHNPALLESADKVFKVIQNKGVSQIDIQ